MPATGRVRWISEKGYGFVELDDGSSAFADARLLKNFDSGDEVLVEVKPGELGMSAIAIGPAILRPS
jgi:cold shock CspA family protein